MNSGTQDLLSTLGLDNEFPEVLFIITTHDNTKFGCWCHNEIHGLACFSTEVLAQNFSAIFDVNMKVIQVDFNEAREIAKQRPPHVICLMLLDNAEDPQIHYVK